MSYGNTEQVGNENKRPNRYKQFSKKSKVRKERKRAKKDVECSPQYGKYFGYF